MKKALVLLVLALLAGSLMAVESAPSATVGFIKFNVTDGNITALTMPFAVADTDNSGAWEPQDALGTNGYTDGDSFIDITDGIGTDYYAGFGWDSSAGLSTLTLGHAYFMNRGAGNGNLTFYLSGTVNPVPVTYTIVGGGLTSMGFNSCSAIPLTDINPANLAEGDTFIEINSGNGADYYDGYGWYSDSMTTTTPGEAYYINSSYPTDYSWTYTPGTTRSSARTSRTATKVLNKTTKSYN